MSNPAIALLTKAAETCEHNAKIQATEGDIDQASLSQGNAVAYRATVVILNAIGGIAFNSEEVSEAFSAIRKFAS